jgi:17beta-estradiol 17-dehydrogenase / very-long-chain 3-oxoacyl-CoA reductase
MYDFPDNLEKVSEERLWNIMQINIGATTLMTHFLIPGMKKRNKGAIINISSGSAMQPTPYMTAYGASKVYVKNFTLALEKELRSHNIWVQLVSPMFVRTKMNNFSTTITQAKRNIFIPSVETYTKFAVFTIGKTKQTTGYWAHGLQVCAMKLVPEFVRTELGAQLNKDLRREYYQQQSVENLK